VLVIFYTTTIDGYFHVKILLLKNPSNPSGKKQI
jgi:hypothetical protein